MAGKNLKAQKLHTSIQFIFKVKAKKVKQFGLFTEKVGSGSFQQMLNLLQEQVNFINKNIGMYLLGLQTWTTIYQFL